LGRRRREEREGRKEGEGVLRAYGTRKEQ